MSFWQWLNAKSEQVIGAFALAVVVGLVFLGVMMRLLFNNGLPWQEELSRILFVLVIYVGASRAAKEDGHIRITLVTQYLPERGRALLQIVTDMVWIGFNLAVCWISIKCLLGPMSAFPGSTPVIGMDLRLPFAIVPLLMFIQALRVAQRLAAKVKELRGGSVCG